MSHNVLLKAARLKKSNKRKKKWVRVVTGMAGVVVFCTTYALILPAITMEQNLICEIEGHEHTEECYKTAQTSIDTGPKEDYSSIFACTEFVHSHTQECMDAESNIICGFADYMVHEHNEFCYDDENILICPFEERTVHTHDENCYDVVPSVLEVGNGDISNEETVEKTTDEAVDNGEVDTTESNNPEVVSENKESVLSCEVKEIVLHKHSDTCFAGGSLICGMLEIIEHIHDESCLETIPETPTLTEQEQEQVNEIQALLNILPKAEEVEAKIQEYIDTDDTEGSSVYKKTLKEQVRTAYSAYSVLNDNQKMLIDNTNLLVLYEQWGKDTLTVLTDDSALVKELNAGEVVILSAQEGTTGENVSDTETDFVYAGNGDTVQLGFTVSIESYTETVFTEGRVKLEFVLPLTEEQASFDLDAMTWLDQTEGYAPVLTTETRILNDTEVSCQVLTAYKYFSADGEAVLPGIYSENVVIHVNEMKHGSNIAVLIGAAMEHSAWDGTCTTHGIVEKHVIASESVTIINPLSQEEQKIFYAQYLDEIDGLQNAETTDEEDSIMILDMEQKIQNAYKRGELSLEMFNDLYAVLHSEVPLDAIAEQVVGTNWLLEREQWLEQYGQYSATSDNNLRRAILRNAVFYSNAAAIDNSDVTFQPATLADPNSGSNVQVDTVGGTNISNDGISVSKTIKGTELENVFDITLQVMTQDVISEVYNEPDMAVVVVMDISNTMNENFGRVTRYTAARDAANKFLEEFAAYTADVSKVGFVAFNSDAHEIFALQTCETDAKLESLKTEMATDTGNIIYNYEKNSDGYTIDKKRFTNIEAGLEMAYDMLNDASVKNKNKYIIFLSDGFPTTYTKANYIGYDTYTSSGTKGADGVFYDYLTEYYCSSGTSYSEKAAVRAREMATKIKNAGAKIFSIGVDIGTQTIDGYERTGLSVIDRPASVKTSGYELGSATDENAFKNWLRTSIGSDYYYDSHDSAGLGAAFADVFKKIREMNAESAHLDWIATDPLPDMAEGLGSTVEFIGFYTRDNKLVTATELKGVSGVVGQDGLCENTISYDSKTNTITWDVKNSGYYAMGVENMTQYVTMVTYRVRLKNEDTGFVENQIYDTNDETTLTYRTILVEEKNGVQNKYVSEAKEINFPIPAVHGYLGELTFLKKDSMDRPVNGAEFTLSHDTKNCSICRGNNNAVDKTDATVTIVEISNQVQTSDADGNVTFTNVPSGHKYILSETKVPDGYAHNGNSYSVEVAYDNTSVTVVNRDGELEDWAGYIINNTYYELPATGGCGTTTMYTFGGLLVLCAVCLMYIQSRRREGEDC